MIFQCSSLLYIAQTLLPTGGAVQHFMTHDRGCSFFILIGKMTSTTPHLPVTLPRYLIFILDPSTPSCIGAEGAKDVARHLEMSAHSHVLSLFLGPLLNFGITHFVMEDLMTAVVSVRTGDHTVS